MTCRRIYGCKSAVASFLCPEPARPGKGPCSAHRRPLRWPSKQKLVFMCSVCCSTFSCLPDNFNPSLYLIQASSICRLTTSHSFENPHPSIHPAELDQARTNPLNIPSEALRILSVYHHHQAQDRRNHALPLSAARRLSPAAPANFSPRRVCSSRLGAL